MMPVSRLITIVWLCMVGLVLTACQRDSDHQTLVFAVAQAPLNLDPRFATDAASERVNRLLYQRLVDFDPSSKPIPGLAEWEQLDATHYRFHLKQNIPVFHHGKPLLAEDIKATYDSLIHSPGPHSAEFNAIQQIMTPDTHTVEFILRRADSHFIERLMIGILPADQLVAGHDFSHSPIGNGPFKFDSWDGNLKITRLKDGLHVRFDEVRDPNVRVLKLKRGEADLLQGDLPPELVRYLQKQPEVVVKTGIGANYSYMGINTQADFLKDVRIRRALAYAIDAQAIVDHVLVDHSRAATAILPPEHYAGNQNLQPYAYNPALARRLLQTAGVDLPLTLTYKTSTDPQRVRLATILQAQMQAAGIDLQIKSLDWGTFYADIQQGKFQLYGLTWVGIKSPEIYAQVFGSSSRPPQGLNRGAYQDGFLDGLLVREHWPAVTHRIHDQLPCIPLWYEGQFVAYRKSVRTFLTAADGNWDALSTIEFDGHDSSQVSAKIHQATAVLTPNK